MSVWADAPWRYNRYDGFKAHKVTDKTIVFFGNSITNMHEWWEAFNNPNIVNRGVNGAETPIMLEHFESILVGKPAKIFLMMGTNDLGTSGMNTPSHVAKSVRTALMRCQKESPNTQVYVQSILPCTGNNIKDTKNVPITNDSLKNICTEFANATYIDLYPLLPGIPTHQYSGDGTHLTMAGYRIWCNEIAKYVGSDCVYPADATDNWGGLSNIAGMRNTYFAALPVKADDIIMLGDDNNDWHELLHANNVKQRGSSWGYPSNDLGTMTSMLNNIFKGRSDNKEPKMVCIMQGYNEMQGDKDVATVAASYKAFVEKVRSYCPNAVIKLFAVIPSPTKAKNAGRSDTFNAEIEKIAASMNNVDYVSGSYTSLLKDGVLNADYNKNGRLNARGYAKLSQVVAEAIGAKNGVTATTDAEVEELIAKIDARTKLVSALQTAGSLSIGNGVGQYTAANAAAVLKGIDEGYALLADPATTNEQLTAKSSAYASLVTSVLPTINMPLASNDTEEHWYQLYTPNRNSKYSTSQGAEKDLIGGQNTKFKNTMWKFVQRDDKSFDIINRADQTYVSPNAEYDKMIKTTATRPNKGWTLSYANVSGVFIISSGNVQLNQTNKDGVCNWSANRNGQDRDDKGCQFAIVDAPAPEDINIDDIDPTCVKGYEISMKTGSFINPASGKNNNFPDGFVLAKSWESTEANPKIKVTTGTNDMMPSEVYKGDYLMWHPTKDYTVSVEGVGANGQKCLITGYTFTYSSATDGQTITVAGQTFTAKAAEQQARITGLCETSTVFKVAGTSAVGKSVILKDFIVKVFVPGSTGDVTAIGNATAPAVSTPVYYYDLQGRRVLTPTKGIFITNQGHKVVIR